MPHLDSPLALRHEPSLARRALRKLLIAALTVLLFVLGWSLLVLWSSLRGT